MTRICIQCWLDDFCHVVTVTMTILLHALTLRSYALSSFGAQCSKPTPNGIDYADANITVVPAATAADCCDACLAHNADPRRAGGNCTIGV